jgi:sulfate transport system ATP-binding protein
MSVISYNFAAVQEVEEPDFSHHPVAVEVAGVTRSFAGNIVLDALDLTIRAGEFVALLGASGSGKTTLLRILAGLDFPDSGELNQGGRDLLRVSARDRGVGLVFQHYALFRHMTVFENIAFGLRVRPRARRPSKAEIAERVDKLLKRVQLDGMAQRYPAQLSGGQRQRVALARALAIEPELLLLDEPFGALDAQVRVALRRWLRHLHEEMGLTTVFVTHDQEEALELADRVVVMNRGRIEQVGTPDEVYDQPASPFVLKFLGDVNLFHGRLDHAQGAAAGAAGGDISYVRPHELQILAAPQTGSVAVRLTQALTVGPNTRLEFKRLDDGSDIDVELPRTEYRALRERLPLDAGATAHLLPRHIRRFAEDLTDPAAMI